MKCKLEHIENEVTDNPRCHQWLCNVLTTRVNTLEVKFTDDEWESQVGVEVTYEFALSILNFHFNGIL